MKFLTIGFLAIATMFSTFASAACPTGNITLSNQSQVDNFALTYAGCTTVPGNVKIKVKGATITNLDGLSVLTAVNGNLEIEWCPNLVDITGLMNITVVNGEIQFEECHALTSLDGLQNLTSCNDIEIKGMDALTDMSQLSGLTALSGELNIKDCDALTSLDGLDNITSIGRSLRIDGNQSLTDLTALNNLTSVGMSIYILNNRDLASLDGLDNIVAIGRDLDIYNNQTLSDCIGVCKVMDAVAAPGSIDIRDNAIGSNCDDVNVLEDECLLALPVRLTDFKAKEDVKFQTVVLSWVTESELNNKHFEIERSVDGRNFQTLGIVNGNGTTNRAINYTFIDKYPVAIAYYRLKQVDFNNEFIYSNIVMVEMSVEEAAQVSIFPTLAHNEITVRFTGFETQAGTYSIFNAQGQLIHAELVDLSNKAAYKTIDVSMYANGIYTLIITDNANHITTNFVVTK